MGVFAPVNKYIYEFLKQFWRASKESLFKVDWREKRRDILKYQIGYEIKTSL